MARGRRDRAIPEVVRNSLTEKFQLVEFGAGLAASKDTATRMPANAEKSQSRICCIFVVAVCARQSAAQIEVIAELHRPRGGPMITISLYRNCYSVFLRRKRHYSGAVQVHERHSVWCKIAHHEDAEHNVCAPVLGRTCRNSKNEDGLVGQRVVCMYIPSFID